MILKQKLKSYLRRRLSSLLGLDTFRKQIPLLFSNIGCLHISAADTNERLAEMTAAFAANSAYMGHPREKKRKVVYTCLTGNYDNLPLHSYLDGDWDYYCQGIVRTSRL